VVQKKAIVAATAIAVATLLTAVISLTSAESSSAALTGVVTSPMEGAMEGVLVSAKRADSTTTVTVVSDAQGRYSFPRNRLEPGEYAIRIRAIGYELDGPGAASVTADRTAQRELTLRKAKDLASQLSNGEWFMSWPGSDEMKNGLLNCTQCHSLERVARTRYTAAEWVDVIGRMSRYSQGSTPERPQLRPGNSTGSSILAQSI
jgi:virginiamycin B lyase